MNYSNKPSSVSCKPPSPPLTLADRDLFEHWVSQMYRVTSFSKAFGHGYIGSAATKHNSPIDYSSLQMLWEAYQAGARSKINSAVPSSSV